MYFKICKKKVSHNEKNQQTKKPPVRFELTASRLLAPRPASGRQPPAPTGRQRPRSRLSVFLGGSWHVHTATRLCSFLKPIRPSVKPCIICKPSARGRLTYAPRSVVRLEATVRLDPTHSSFKMVMYFKISKKKVSHNEKNQQTKKPPVRFELTASRLLAPLRELLCSRAPL